MACAVNDNLITEWMKYLEETRMHETILLETFARISLDPATETPGRAVVRFKGSPSSTPW